MTPCQKCYWFLISEFSWKDFITRDEINQFLFVSHAVDVLAYVLRVVWWLWSTANLFKCSNGLWYRRQPPRLVNLHSFGLIASLVNTLPKRPPYATVKNLGPSGLKWLAAFFSTCMRLNLLPKIWRKANIMSILKPGKDAKVAKSYRPISLLCVPFKILERVILSRITPYIEKCLPDFQAGFRAGRSTIDQVLQLCSTVEDGFQLNKKLLLHSLIWQLPMTRYGTKVCGWNRFVQYLINIW